MIRKLLAALCLLSFSSLAPFSAGLDAWALAEHFKHSLKEQLHFIIAQNPRYVWGGYRDPDEGLDCSGYLFLAARRAGIPGITRTTSLRMSMGLGGWSSKTVAPEDADDCDLVFWTFTDKRPNGHVGVFLPNEEGLPEVTHASFSRGVVLEPLHGLLLKNLTTIRRLTIGDEE